MLRLITLVTIVLVTLAPNLCLDCLEPIRLNKKTLEQEAKKILLPTESGAWLAKLTRSGGYVGSKGSIIINSKGEAAAGRNYLYACESQLSPQELSKLDTFVSAVNVSHMSTCANADEPKRGADRKRTQIELHQRGDDGAEHILWVAWYSGEEKKASTELVGIADAMTVIEKRVIERCRMYR